MRADLWTYACNDVRFARKGRPDAWCRVSAANGAMFRSYPYFSEIPTDDNCPVQFDDLAIDIDVPEAMRVALVIIGWFQQVFGIEPEQWRAYLSGKKGVHLELPAEILGTENGHTHLMLGYKRLAKDVEAECGVSIDLSMYNMGTGKPYRQPNVMRETGTCKRQITVEDLYEITTPEEYIEACCEEGPTWEPEDTSRNDLLATKMAEYLKEAAAMAEAIRNQPPMDDETREKLAIQLPPCIAFLSGVTHQARTSATFNDVSMQLTAYAVTVGMSEADLIGMSRPFIEQYPSTKSPAERYDNVKSRYRSMSANGYSHSCAAVKALRFGGYDCAKCGVVGLGEHEPDSCEFRLYEEKQRAKKTDVMEPPGILKDIADFFNASARRAQPEFAVHAAITLASAVLGRRYRTTQGNYSSLYMLFVAKSAAGKENIKSTIRAILTAANLGGKLIGPGGYTSDTAVMKALQAQPQHVAMMDEFGRRLEEAAETRSKGQTIGMISTLLEVFGVCDGVARGKAFAERDVIEVVNPALTLACITSEKSLAKSVTVRMSEDGFLNRFLPCYSEQERQPIRHPGIVDPPESVVQWCRDYGPPPIDQYSDGGPILSAGPRDRSDVPFDPGCLEEFSRFDEFLLKKAAELDAVGLGDMPGREMEIAMRLSMICALARRAVTVSIDDARWAIAYVSRQYRVYVGILKKNIAGSEYESSKMDFLSAIRAVGADGVSTRELGHRKPFSTLKKRDRDEILEDLKESGFIVFSVMNNGKKGRPKGAWRAIIHTAE